MQSILTKNLEKHIKTLTEDVGIRLAGSVGERRAADYIAEELRGVGAEVYAEDFYVRERAVKEEHDEFRQVSLEALAENWRDRGTR